MACGAIAAGLTLSCTNPLKGGNDATFYIANFDDIASYTVDGTNAFIVESITMVALKVFYTYEGKLKSTEPAARMIKGNYENTWEHEVKARIFAIDPTTKKQVANMKDGRFVVIIKNNHRGTNGNSKYEVYGLGSALYAESLERVPQNTDDNGAWNIVLKTQEYGRESTPPLTLWDTDEATTDALVAALLV